MEYETKDADDNIEMKDKNTYKETESENESVEEEYCSDATYLARQMASAEKLCQSDLIVIILKEIQCNKILISRI